MREYNRFRVADKIERENKCIELGSVSNKSKMKKIMINKEDKYDPDIFIKILNNWIKYITIHVSFLCKIKL